VGLAFLREATDTRIRRPEDVEGHGHTLLGVVPSMDPEIAERYDGQDFIEVDGWRLSTCLVPLLNPWSSVTENYRLIRANLGHNNGEGPARSLLVTSALKGEGKTVTAVNLALTEAMSGRSTLLIDADMRKPSAHEALGISRSPGLSSVLTEGTNGEALRETLLEDLFFLPAGVPEGGPANVLDPERFQRFLEHMREQFDVVVIDTPPSEAASDSIIIGTEATVKAVVVSAAQGDARALNSVTESLETAGVPVAGVVLNRFDDKTQLNADYGYSYYGHDGEYADYRTASIERNAEVGQIESG
jgi:capsular exopolysaccharide synthesis family protein